MGLINHVPANGFINPGGPPFFKLHFFLGQRGLINTAGFINPNLTLYIYIYIIIFIYIYINIHDIYIYT